MNLGIESYQVWKTLGTEGCIRAVKEAGFDAVDWSFYWEATPYFCGDDYIEKAEEVRDLLRNYGLKCNQSHAPFDFLSGMPEEDSCFEYLSIKRAIEAAGIIGADHIVVHGVAVKDSAVSEESIRYNLSFYRKLEPVAKANGVKIAIENLSGAFTYPMLLNRILKELDSPQFVGLCDVGHAWLRANMQPGAFIRQLDQGVLKGIHIQDNHGIALGVDEHIAPYLGTVDFEDLTKALAETGYEGDFTLELPRFLKMYAGHDLLIPALSFACAVGRKLVKDIEEAK